MMRLPRFRYVAPHSLSEMYPVQLPSAPKEMPAVRSAKAKPAANFIFMVIPLLRLSKLFRQVTPRVAQSLSGVH